jgi:hypothetical protein
MQVHELVRASHGNGLPEHGLRPVRASGRRETDLGLSRALDRHFAVGPDEIGEQYGSTSGI